MAQALPLAKLASLLVKTAAKPLSKRVKHDFSKYAFTKQLLVRLGQTTHVVTSRMQIWSAGYRVRSIKPLEPEKALKDGADLVGESFIFAVSGGLVVWEFNRSSESAKRKRAAELAKQAEATRVLQAKLRTLDLRLKAVEKVVKHNSTNLLNLGGNKYVEPAATEIVSIDDDDQDQSDIDARIPEQTTTSSREEPSNSPWWKVWS